MKKSKRAIDRMREGAGSFQVTTDDDDSPIVAMVPVDNRMLIVKELGLYELQLADQIDPDRTNPKVPNTVQQILKLGSKSYVVSATILLAHHMLKPGILPDSVDCVRAMKAVYEVMLHLGKMQRLADEFTQAEKRAVADLEKQGVRKDGSYVLPTSRDLGHNVESFIQNANLALVDLLQVIEAFGEANPGRKWFEGLLNSWKAEIGEEANCTQMLAEVLPFLKLVRNARHCIEHEKEGQRLVVRDFALGSDLSVNLPSIEIVHSETAISTMPISQFIEIVLERLIETTEVFLVLLCEKHIAKVEGGFKYQVVSHPEDQRPHGYLRYSYAVELDGQLVPMY